MLKKKKNCKNNKSKNLKACLYKYNIGKSKNNNANSKHYEKQRNSKQKVMYIFHCFVYWDIAYERIN